MEGAVSSSDGAAPEIINKSNVYKGLGARWYNIQVL